MYSPSIQQLLSGLRRALAADVLPVLDDEVARRQLKAGLHMLGRLERVQPGVDDYLHEDSGDLVEVLDVALSGEGELGEHDWVDPLRTRLLELQPQPTSFEAGLARYRGLMELAIETERSVRELAVDTERSRAVRARALTRFTDLHGRMLERQAVAWGLVEGTDDG